jgi:hypothetical protein
VLSLARPSPRRTAQRVERRLPGVEHRHRPTRRSVEKVSGGGSGFSTASLSDDSNIAREAFTTCGDGGGRARDGGVR